MKDSDTDRLSPVPFVVFSDDWGVHPSSSQHIFRHISENHHVAWINTVGMRRPRLNISDLKKGLRKLFNMLRKSSSRGGSAIEYDISVYQPMMIPFNDIPIVRRINKKLVERTLRKVVRDLDGQEPIVVTSVPNACDYVDSIRSKRIVYYCVDDFSEWPGLDKELVLEMEAQLIDKADIFLATSPRLVARLAKSGKPTSLLSHGVDIDLFSADVPDEHPTLDDIPEPRVGYFGLFDALSDQDLIAAVAEKMPEVSFVIAGRVETPVENLMSVDNVYFIGQIPYLELPALVKGLDVLFIPYIVNALSDALSPLKFREYLATGRPILSTPIAAAAEFDAVIRIASTAEDWQEEIQNSLSENLRSRRNEVTAALAGESWRERSKQFLYHCIR